MTLYEFWVGSLSYSYDARCAMLLQRDSWSSVCKVDLVTKFVYAKRQPVPEALKARFRIVFSLSVRLTGK